MNYLKFAESVQLFAEHAVQGRRLSALTIRAYESDLRGFVAWRTEHGLPLTVGAVQAADIEDYAADCGHLSPATVRRRLDAISSLFKFLVKRGLAAINPVDSVDRPRCPDTQRPHLTPEQMGRLLEVVEQTNERAILLLLCLLGLRRSEVLKLNIGDVEVATGRLHVLQSKGGHSRILPIPSDLTPVLQAQLSDRDSGPEDPLFVSSRSNRLSRSVLARLFGKWLKLAGLDGLGLSPHSCRHGAASRWLNSGLNIIEVQHLLGHSSVDVTGRYCHASLSQIAAAIESKVPALGASPSPVSADGVPTEWHGVLAKLDDKQREALLTIARSMAPSTARGP